jgi:hypothetical protein
LPVIHGDCREVLERTQMKKKLISNLPTIAVLVFISIITKVLVLAAPFFIPHTGLDVFDHQYFFDSAQQLVSGIYPPGFSYPPFALVPMVIAYLLSFGNHTLFSSVFQLLMCLCDAITIACIYLVGTKFLTKQQAFTAGLIYAISISVAYFSLTKFDSVPAMLLMLAIYFTICGKQNLGEWLSVFGFATKIYPIIALPFLYFYNRREVSGKVYAALAIGAVVALVFFRDAIISSLIRSNVYVNTPSYVISSAFGFSENVVSWTMYALLAFALLLILGYLICRETDDVRGLLVAIGVAIFAVVVSMQYHSPQYLCWYFPIFCLLVADRTYALVALCTVSIMVYAEFPLLYNVIYQNGKLLIPGAAWFFVIEWAVMFLMVWLAIVSRTRPTEKNINK